MRKMGGKRRRSSKPTKICVVVGSLERAGANPERIVKLNNGGKSGSKWGKIGAGMGQRNKNTIL